MHEREFRTNRSLWDLKTDIHLRSEFYDLDGFRKGRCSLPRIDLEGLGEVRGKKVLHLQCHFGQDTLSLARMGAEVTGVDFSGKAIEAARRLADELGLAARFIECNVYDLPALLDEAFDLVYTSWGVLGWLPDLGRWAEVVGRYVRPGGRFFMAEFHPVLYLFDWERREVAFDYFNRGTAWEEEHEGTYADPDAPIRHKEYFWCHSLDEVIQPLIDQGLRLQRFREYDYSPWNCFPHLVERAPGEYVFDFKGLRLAHAFSLDMARD